ncbi:MAG: agmatinase [Candidatus Tectomicrobia bacterium]|nr:agmatinase [Candidatus Tectomicrobia bacterium]
MAEQKESPQTSQQDDPIRSRLSTFFGAPLCTNLDQLKADIAFLGIPFDQATTARAGTRYGPKGVRDASMSYSWPPGTREEEMAKGWFDVEKGYYVLGGKTMADCGDVDIRPEDMMKNYDRMTQAVEKVLKTGVFPVIVGGDHALTFPVVRAFQIKGYDLNIVHFDTHLDFTDENRGVRYSHGNPLRRAFELPFVKHITSIGIRGALRRIQSYKEAVEMGVNIITAEQFLKMGPKEAIATIPEADHYYVTLDIDVMDPALAPGTGTPEPGGLNYYQFKDGLLELTKSKQGKIVGFDLVEVAPPYDWVDTTSRVAARLILDFLGAIFPTKLE